MNLNERETALLIAALEALRDTDQRNMEVHTEAAKLTVKLGLHLLHIFLDEFEVRREYEVPKDEIVLEVSK